MQEKPSVTLSGQECPFCENGVFGLVQVDYRDGVPDEPVVAVRDVWVEKCDACGEVVFPSETSDYIDSFIACATDRLPPTQIKGIRESLGVGTDLMAAVIGLSRAEYARLEDGTQYPSASMCRHLRVLGELHETFKHK